MVILLVGIMTVVQMFPSGFKVVRAAESQTIATKLAQAEVERWQNMPDNLPDGILPVLIDYSTSPPTIAIQNSQYPGPPFQAFQTDANGNYVMANGIYTPGNALNIRQVFGETTAIPFGTTFKTGGGVVYGGRYNLAFSPIEVWPNDKGTFDGISIKSGDLRRRRGEAEGNNYPPYMRPSDYAIDYTLSAGNPASFNVAFPDRNTSHHYKLCYSYWIHNTTTDDWVLLSQLDQDVVPSSDGDWVPVTVNVPSAYSGYVVDSIEPNSDSCARGFDQLAPGDDWSANDPYEFIVVDSILGVIAFNPYARGMTEYTARGIRPVTARIDYLIADPRIIREDRVAPEPNVTLDTGSTPDAISVKLSLKFILNAGNPTDLSDGDPTDNPDEPTFEGLIRDKLGLPVSDSTPPLVAQSMLIIDLATGLRVDMANVKIDYQSGTVTLPVNANLIDWSNRHDQTTTNVPLKGRHLRFYYRADGDWSVQCHKAYTLYQRKYNDSEIDYFHFELIGNSNVGYKLLFAQCDSGKNVSVSYSYITQASGNSDPVVHQVVGKNCRISDDWVTQSGINFAYVDLNDVPEGASIDPNSRILVSGTSFRARVIWRDGTHWRFTDMDTNLTRNSSP